MTLLQRLTEADTSQVGRDQTTRVDEEYRGGL